MAAPLDIFSAPEAPSVASDPVTVEAVLALADADTPCATVVVKTHSLGRASVQGARRLSQMTKRLSPMLGAAGFDDRAVHKFLAPLRALADDADFWQHQSRSLVLFRTPRWTWRWRLDHDLPEELSLASSARIRVLLPSLGVNRFHVLAISQNHVRVLTVTGNHVEKRAIPGLPRSLRHALRFESHDKNLGFHSTGSQLHRHGSGIGREVEKEKVRRYLQSLDRAMVAATHEWTLPVVLACTDESAAMYQGLTHLAHLAPDHVPGSPERTSDADLVRLAAPIAARMARAQVVDGRDAVLFAEMDGTGRVVREVRDTLAVLEQGAVEALFVADVGPAWGTVSAGVVVESSAEEPAVIEEDLLGRCVVGALRQGARVHLVAPGSLGPDVRVAALTRY